MILKEYVGSIEEQINEKKKNKKTIVGGEKTDETKKADKNAKKNKKTV